VKNRNRARTSLGGGLVTFLAVGIGSISSAATFAGVLTYHGLTYHNDNQRSGQNLNETILAHEQFKLNQFGLLISDPVDGYVYGQPLYIPGVDLGSAGTHNVVIVVTEHYSAYAFDADTFGSTLWHDSFVDLAQNTTTVPSADVDCDDIVPEIGITGTPVINPDTDTVYLLSEVKEPGLTYVQQLHALDLTNGDEQPNSPVTITVQVAGTGDGEAPVIFINMLRANQRALLTLVKIEGRSTVYAAFASHGDLQPYPGWVPGYDAKTLEQVPVFNDSPNSSEAGIWQSGRGPGVDAEGNLFVVSGNGTFDLNTGGVDYGDSVINLAPDANGALSAASFFTPSDQQVLDDRDLDLGTAGSLLLPDQTVGPPHLMIMSGQQGIVYLLNRDSLGGFNVGGDEVVQGIAYDVGPLYSTATYWNGKVYFAGSQDKVKAFSFSKEKLSIGPRSISNLQLGFDGATTSLSANGDEDGILWLIDNSGFKTSSPAVLHALDPTRLTKQLYSSAAVSTDDPGPAVKFTVPTVAKGKVYQGTEDRSSVLGLTIPQVTLSTKQLKFGKVSVNGGSKAKHVTIRNPAKKGGPSIVLNGIETNGPFVADDSGCPAALAPGQSCSITVTFTPLVASSVITGQLTIDDNSTVGSLSVQLSGIGIVPKGH
jgi:hypothetical protein